MIALRKIAEDTVTETIGWDPVPSAAGYRFTVNGVRSHTWNPARDQVRVSKGKQLTVEALGVMASGVWPTSVGSPLGFMSHRWPGYFPPTHIDRYEVVLTVGPRPAGFRGINLRYMTTITCRDDGTNNISAALARANGWTLLDTNGQELTNAKYSGVLADVGHPGYQQAWCERMHELLRQGGEDGFWGDDFTPSINAVTDGRWPARYQTEDAMIGAMLSFARFVRAYCDRYGLKSGYNAACVSDTDASRTIAWFRRLGPLAHYLTVEYWMRLAHPAEGVLRTTGSDHWTKFWDQWRAVHVACNEAGTNFLPIAYPGGELYTLATLLLDYDGKAAAMLADEPLDKPPVDPWKAPFEIATSLGAALGPAGENGNVWSRRFANGTVTVDPVEGKATIA